ncbi:MAG: FAD-dependent oxidoreductase [Polaromonas sp.]|uniref:FAD-dependent oxidoreductase n=1 Tax=Polaromonas sp. TaxID=1869339 RepID=UPI00272FDB96|nr:FAD-dependent oxidoreductase [Polaromonas sp.]MDP2448965.1 FAD-dependent oxidoreductase [Polaromonas sp.]MDP3248888.1 FAD-dependent oxidoreductase [Polaromonas sp.]MDP3754474.1 FAD-dependent oxidoreductase [Polaromonas sp.]
MSFINEPARSLPVYGEFDVVVIGGGPAGLAASVSAAKHGARTLLVERYGFLGGMGTAGGVTNFAGLYGRKNGEMRQVVHGVVDDLLARMDALGGLNQPQDGMGGRIRVRSYDVSAYKCAADQMLVASGVQILFHAWAAAVLMDGQAITALVVETKSGRQAIRARRFIDCSGDADVAHFAGVPFELGDGHGSALFPSTMFRVGHVDAGPALAAVGEFKAINDLMEQSETRQPGRYQFPRKGAILRPQKNPAEWRANVTQIRNAAGNAMDATDARQLSEGELEGRRQITEYFRFLKNEVPGFADSAIIDIAPQVGIRETRRICGAYMLTGEDILSSARFFDVIGINAWPMEMHVDGAIRWGFPRDENRAYNDLPWRMLLTREVDNLLVAGRCASMAHEGQSAARASGGCFVMGQAAGTAAARLADGAAFAATDVAHLQQVLLDDGVYFDR